MNNVFQKFILQPWTVILAELWIIAILLSSIFYFKLTLIVIVVLTIWAVSVLLDKFITNNE